MQSEIQAKLAKQPLCAGSQIAEADLRQILEKAILAPSGHNWQPWQFRIRQDGVELHIVRQPIMEFIEQDDHARYLSAGAVIENMCISAASLGYSVVAQYFPIPENPLFVAYIRFTGLSPADYHLLDLCHLLDARCTNRGFYDAAQPMDYSKLLTLSQLASQTASTRLVWIGRDTAEFPMVAGLCGRSEQLFFECERGHAEILEGIRFRTESAAMQRDGLDVRTLDLGPMGTAMLKTCRSWNVQTLLNQFGASRLVNFVTQRQIKSSSAVGLVISDSSDHLSVVLSGRVMERIWLVATKLGLSLQPLYAILPLIRYPTSRERFFSASQILAIERMVGDFRMLFGCSESNAQFLFRIGHGCTPKVRSLRKPLASFILTDERSGSSLTESCHNFEPIRTPLSDKLVNTAQLRIEPSEVS